MQKKIVENKITNIDAKEYFKDAPLLASFLEKNSSVPVIIRIEKTTFRIVEGYECEKYIIDESELPNEWYSMSDKKKTKWLEKTQHPYKFYDELGDIKEAELFDKNKKYKTKIISFYQGEIPNKSEEETK